MPKPKKPKAVVKAPRNYHAEQALCAAIGKRVLVRLLYKDDVMPRLFAPYGVYEATTGKFLVAGTQLNNPADPLSNYEPRNLEVGLIRGVAPTDTTFAADPRFNPFDEKHERGFLCRI